MTDLRCKEWFRQHWTENSPTPANLNDTEILDFLNEYCDGMTHVQWTAQTPSVFILDCEMITATRGETLREAACLAKAKIDEVNRDEQRT